ncbi:MAG: sugar ABC transporter ATP-binding protein [Spirochaetia bacterium]|nr:sugar ABC transporter ATP-binding protein [Spirochaetia bacterium]
MNTALLEAESVSKEFSGVRVLNKVTLSLNQGEILGVIGENGAGKSTFMKILSGIYSATEGIIRMGGEQVEIRDPINAKKLGITMIPQEFNLVSTLAVFENVFLGNELVKNGLLDKASMRRRTQEVLSELQTDISPDARMMDLSVAQKQMVELGKALVHESKILIMDEPTTVLNSDEVKILFHIMEKLKKRGVSIVFISHKLKEVKAVCGRVLILRDGEQISLSPTASLSIDQMARGMVGRELNQVFPRKQFTQGEDILKVEGLTVPGLLDNISFSLKRGEILGFAGLMGAGRTELAETIMGIRQKSGGRVFISGEKVEIDHPREAVKHGIAYLSEDRQGKGLIMDFTVPQNITLVSLRRYIKGFIDRKKEQAATDEYVRSFNIKAASLFSKLRFLSGGNQQKVYLAKWMDTKPDILILDEPTRGIDVNAKMEIYQFVRELAKENIACMFISSELEEIMGMCHRVLVMREGRLAGEIQDKDMSEEEIMFYATGIKEGISV